MKSKALLVMLTILLITMSLFGCTTNTSNDLENELKLKEDQINLLITEKDALKKELSELQEKMNTQQANTLLNKALVVIDLLKNKDMDSLATYIHPDKGVRFTPYAYVDLQNDLVFTAQQIGILLQSNQSYLWGAYDGTGDPIQATFSNYYDKFVYDVDFANPHMIGNNVRIGQGNSLNNITQVYPNGSFVEFHFTGFDAQYDGIDWRSLRLVFEELNGTWYLVGIIHDQWTI